MTTANPTQGTATQRLIDQRLDTIDRALLGLIPRGDRLAMVAQVEAKIRELATANPAEGATHQEPAELSVLADSASFVSPAVGMPRAAAKRRSRLALSAGVLGILALVLLVGTPVIYIIVSILADALDEVVAISLLGAHVGTIALGGTAAVTLGIAALVKLGRHQRELVGHGWAITGLCTGPLPMLVGCLIVLVVGSQTLLVQESPGPVAGPAPKATLENRASAVEPAYAGTQKRTAKSADAEVRTTYDDAVCEDAVEGLSAPLYKLPAPLPPDSKLSDNNKLPEPDSQFESHPPTNRLEPLPESSKAPEAAELPAPPSFE